MSQKEEGQLERAEGFLRRVLARLGSRLDERLGRIDASAFAPSVVDALITQLESTIESDLIEDEQGLRRLSPNVFKVGLPYDQASGMGRDLMLAVEDELSTSVAEYIANRRYHTRGPVRVRVVEDVFAKAPTVRAEFEAPEKEHPGAAAACRIEFEGAGRSFPAIDLDSTLSPKSVGRSSGLPLRIDDPSVSRIHASLAVRANGEIVVSDLGSANGTAVNGRSLGRGETTVIKAGDSVRFGDIELRLVSVEIT